MTSISDILVTPALHERAARVSDPAAELALTRTFGRLLGSGAAPIYRTMCREALQRCHAQSAGLSMFEPDPLDELTWVAVEGALAGFEGGRFPRRYSMCGVCLEMRSPQLFVNPHTYYSWLQATAHTVMEALVVPLMNREQRLVGTLWVMDHDKVKPFDQGDADTLVRLASYAAISLDLSMASEPGSARPGAR